MTHEEQAEFLTCEYYRQFGNNYSRLRMQENMVCQILHTSLQILPKKLFLVIGCAICHMISDGPWIKDLRLILGHFKEGSIVDIDPLMIRREI